MIENSKIGTDGNLSIFIPLQIYDGLEFGIAKTYDKKLLILNSLGDSDEGMERSFYVESVNRTPPWLDKAISKIAPKYKNQNFPLINEDERNIIMVPKLSQIAPDQVFVGLGDAYVRSMRVLIATNELIAYINDKRRSKNLFPIISNYILQNSNTQHS